MAKTAKNVPMKEAMDYVLGYVLFFDISVQGITRYTRFLTKGQAAHSPCGSWIATKDEVPDPHKVTVKSWVSRTPSQNFSSEFMANKISAQVAWLSQFVRLEAGDLSATGTFHGGRLPINNDDFLEIEISEIGKAEFPVKGDGPVKIPSGPSRPKRAPSVADACTITRV